MAKVALKEGMISGMMNSKGAIQALKKSLPRWVRVKMRDVV